jgi:Glycosyl hydrolases family 18
MPAAKCKIFQSTYLGKDNDPNGPDGGWERMWRTIQNGKCPFKYVDRIAIAFARISATNPDNASLIYEGSTSEKAIKTIAEARKQNPDIELIAQMDWASNLEPLVEDPKKAGSRLDTFAKSIPVFLKKYNLDGIDFDWEGVPPKMTTENATFLFTQTRKHLGDNQIPIMTITPDTPGALDLKLVDKLFDAVIIQSYERVDWIEEYLKDIKPSILFCGICSEHPDPN